MSTGYPDDLKVLLEVAAPQKKPINMQTLSVGGATVATMAGRIVADLAAADPAAPDYILLNLGANDVSALPAEATWKADLATVIDGMNAKWPATKVYLMRPWRRGEATDCDTLAGWIADVVAARSAWAFMGPDERVFLENGDDGVTYTSDGIHPNAAGYALTAAQWKATLGY